MLQGFKQIPTSDAILKASNDLPDGSLGWSLVLLGSAGWSSSRLPRALCVLYLIGGIASLFVYLFPNLEGAAAMLDLVWAVWQGFFLWKGEPGETQTPEIIASQLDQN